MLDAAGKLRFHHLPVSGRRGDRLQFGFVEQAQDAPDGVVVDQGRQPSEEVGGRYDGLVGSSISISVEAERVGYGQGWRNKR